MSGEKEAFCSLLFRAHGGTFNKAGRPLQSTARGLCTKPFDCFQCPLMQDELTGHPSNVVMWVCPACIGDVIKLAKEKGVYFDVPGHYTEGQCQFYNCSRPPRIENGESLPKGYSILLQLFIGEIS